MVGVYAADVAPALFRAVEVRLLAWHLDEPVAPDGPDPGAPYRLDGGVDVLRAVEAVGDLDRRGRPRLQRREPAGVGPGEEVVGLVKTGVVLPNAPQEVDQVPLGGDAAHRGHPEVLVGVDEPGDQERATGVDRLRPVGG